MNKLIEIIKYIIIGIIQGVTEILPISSSGHLLITYSLLNINNENQLDLTIFLHFASCLALLIYFKKIILNLIQGTYKYVIKKDMNRKEDFILMFYLFTASIPVAIVGIVFKDYIDQIFNNPKWLFFFFLFTAVILLLFDKLKKFNSPYNFKNTFSIGLMQCICLLPGISRSGITMFFSRLFKLEESKGKTFSFLVLIPISLGSFILSFIDMIKNISIKFSFLPLYIISMITAFVFSLLSLKIIFERLKNFKYSIFSLYLITLSIFILFFYF